MNRARTPQQTIGPFFHEALRWPDGWKAGFAEAGAPLVLTGRVTDGEGAPVGDAMIESWQLSPAGGMPASATGSDRPHGFARVETGADGDFRIETALPGGSIPSLDIVIHARGLLRPLRTRVFFAGKSRARDDPVARALADSPRLETLVASPVPDRPGEYRWDIRLQGEDETVFLEA